MRGAVRGVRRGEMTKIPSLPSNGMQPLANYSTSGGSGMPRSKQSLESSSRPNKAFVSDEKDTDELVWAFYNYATTVGLVIILLLIVIGGVLNTGNSKPTNDYQSPLYLLVNCRVPISSGKCIWTKRQESTGRNSKNQSPETKPVLSEYTQ